jgi:hypothetical protein
MTTATYDQSGFTRVVIHFVLIAFTAGCTTMQPVNETDAESVSAQIEIGDKIEITRNDLSSVKFKVTAISDDGISGDGTFVAFSDIQHLQLQHKRDNKAGKIIGGVILGAAAVTVWAIGSGLEGWSNSQ